MMYMIEHYRNQYENIFQSAICDIYFDIPNPANSEYQIQRHFDFTRSD